VRRNETMMILARSAAHRLLGPYRLNRIYRLDLEDWQPAAHPPMEVRTLDGPEPLEASPDPEIRKAAAYAGTDAYGYGLWAGGQLAAVCWLWGARRFRDALIWTLQDDEAMLVELVTGREFRGRGYAPALIAYAAQAMQSKGTRRLYTWIWRSNYPSIAAFEKAGWAYIAFVFELYPLGRRRPLRLVRRLAGSQPAMNRPAASG
jgi:RimJ/RimL family protein N-acetyltransferase